MTIDAFLYLANTLFFVPFAFPAVPWFFGARSGRKSVWISTGCVIVILCLFPFLFGSACVASNCGQGAIAIFMLGPIWIASALFTVISAVLRVKYIGK